MPDGHVNAIELFLSVAGFEVLLLVYDSVNRDGCFPSLPITDDKFSLSSSNGDEAIDRLQAGLHRLMDRLSGDNTGSLELDSSTLSGFQRAKTVDRVSKGVDNSS